MSQCPNPLDSSCCNLGAPKDKVLGSCCWDVLFFITHAHSIHFQIQIEADTFVISNLLARGSPHLSFR